MVSMNGPLTGSAMTIDGRMEAIKITLSHPIVLLVIHAVKNLIPEKVCSHFCTTAHTLYMTLFMYCVLCIVCTLTRFLVFFCCFTGEYCSSELLTFQSHHFVGNGMVEYSSRQV